METDKDQRRASTLKESDRFFGSMLGWFGGHLFRSAWSSWLSSDIDLRKFLRIFNSDISYKDANRVGGVVVALVECHGIR